MRLKEHGKPSELSLTLVVSCGCVKKFSIVFCGYRQHFSRCVSADGYKLEFTVIKATKKADLIQGSAWITKLVRNDVVIVKPCGGLDLLASYATTDEEGEE